MYLKSLTLRGFKSFASSTTLRLEPGITCVVGPNGSGKSNVVDAIAWVLGEQGAKALRGGTMSDVIFAGTPSRPPLGRAEVLLTIDNSDGALPIEYSEVTIGRLMFRSGQSEYTINGSQCRLLDIQELMSDSGIGRELHVIVGQGQLDAVLHASPEERRAFVEEAAGVLKHRKRKEKALRKLEAMQANLTRLTDLSAELRRQLGPLGRQAEIARKAGVIQATLRDARLRLLADELVTARNELASDIADEEAVRARLAETEAAHAAVAERERALEEQLAAAVPRATAAQETWYALSSVRERLRGTGELATERARLLRAGAQVRTGGRDPQELEQEAAAIREREAALLARLERDRETLAEVVRRRAEIEAALAEEEKALLAAARAAAARREGVARLAGQVEAARSKAAAAEADIVRLTEALEAASARDAEASGAREALDTELAQIEAEREELAARHESAVAMHAAATERLETLRARERAADRDRASAAARRDALAFSLRPTDGVAALLVATGAEQPARQPAPKGGQASGGRGDQRLAGRGEPARVPDPPDTPIEVVGRLAKVLAVAPGAEVAIAAALGPAADALAVGSVDDVATALRWLRATEAGRATLVPASPAPPASPVADLPEGATPAPELVRVSDERFAPAVAGLLAGVVVADDLGSAVRIAKARPELRVVTRDGDALGPPAAVGGSAGQAPSAIELAAAAEEAEAAMATAAAEAEAVRGAMEAAREEVTRTRAAIDAANSARSAAAARHRALTEQLDRLDKGRGSAAGEISRLQRARLAAEATRDQAYGALAELEARLAASAEEDDEDEERSPAERDRLVAASSAVRAEEVEARLAVRTSEERARGLAGRADALVRQAAQERAARAAAARTRELRERQAAVAAAVAAAAADALVACDASLAAAAAEREQADAARRATETELTGVRERVRAYGAALAALRDEAHRDELAREAKRLRVEALEAKAMEEHGIAADDLVNEYGPHMPVPPDEDGGEPRPFDRAEQTARLATAEKQLARLGKVNPLALEEYAALQERAAFLSAQLDDIKNTRRDLLLVVEEVDSRVREVFAAAFRDTAREFEIVFETLFPGGEGRLVLTDPEDMLTTGIEVEARPPGKKVKRLSLLSGGERSLTALALLLAIFRARPSPFYVLDEVEAALDDRNLGRLLNAIEGLRQKSQLIIITHQKRTMEIADALYGVSMRGDGVTTVISQRLRERASA
ncbi:MAG: chromosome segregation protein SMC [Frankia sp.]|nr:chromosome segregation protein SMC [Frankia sp.]